MIDLVASLTAVDGAVLMNPEFDVLGFGTRIAIDAKNADMELDFVDWIDGEFQRRKGPMSALGMRHLSAAEFVRTNGGLAIVVSQDGNLRIFGRNEETNAIECDECFAPFGSWAQERIIQTWESFPAEPGATADGGA